MENGADKQSVSLEERVLLLAPLGRDAHLLCTQLKQRGFSVVVFQETRALCEAIASGAGVVFVAEEALIGNGMDCLTKVLNAQPPWSDLPLILMTGSGEPSAFSRHLEAIFQTSGNFTLLERPIRLLTLFSVVASALRSRRRQYEVRRLLDETKRAVAQRDQFLAMLGHELRNPLAAIVSAVTILRKFGAHDPELTLEQIGLIARQSSHMTRLVDDLLDVARITSGKISLNLEVVDLRDLAAKALQTLKLMTGQQRHEISFETTGVPVSIEADPVRMEQVIVNLLNNAVKYTPEGGRIWVSVTDGTEATLRIRDSGAGLSSELLERMFEPFARAAPTLARSRGGLGIGLAVVRSLVEMHKGRVEAFSEGVGKGAEFVIHLPAVKKPAAQTPQEAVKGSMQPRKILLVEDNPDARLSLARLLRLYGHEVETAEDGRQGLERALSTQADVMLLDIGLPEVDGYELAEKIRARRGRDVFLIALTGYGQEDDREKAMKAGFDLHLTKPLDPDLLADVLGSRRPVTGRESPTP